MGTTVKYSVALCSITLAFAPHVYANGGPVQSYVGGGQGGGVFLGEHDVHLVEEELTLSPDSDGEYYAVRAVYRLDDRGQKTPIRYGVPIFRNLEGHHQRKSWREVLEESRASIVIELAGERRGCSFQAPKADQSPPPPRSFPFHWSDTDYVPAWCVAEIVVPPGQSELILSYRSQLEYEDVEFNTASFTQPSVRLLQYPLFPASYWRGEPRRVAVRIERSFDYELELVEPKGLTVKSTAGAFEFVLSGQRFAESPYLIAKLDEKALLQRKVLSVNDSHRVRVVASSTLAPGPRYSYAAHNVVDGKRSTAWCEGAPGLGVGEWVELRFTPTGLGFVGFAVLPGYTSSSRTLASNSSPGMLRVSVCGQPAVYIDFDLGARSRRPTRALRVLEIGGMIDLEAPNGQARSDFLDAFDAAQPPEAEVDDWVEACLRLEIRSVRPGSTHADTCISEVVPFSGL